MPGQLRSSAIRPFARLITKRMRLDMQKAVVRQSRILNRLLHRAKNTQFGKEHGFSHIKSHKDFAAHVPLRDYESLRPYIDRIIDGHSDILWPGKPRYFAKTSGTTSGTKYIPITPASIPNHIRSARNALFNYFIESGNGRFFDGKMIFLSGSPVLEHTGGIHVGRLSGIVNHLVPKWIRTNQMPSHETNCVEDWEEKVTRIVDETHSADMRLISGIPPWVQMYYEKLLEKTGKNSITEIFPNYSLFVHGGVAYSPYEAKLKSLVGDNIDTLETYPASEGFIAYQDTWPFEGLRLNVNSGIFFEFIPLGEFHAENPRRLGLKDVQLDQDYAIIINSNAGLWGYNIGDMVRFVSKNPYRIIVTGRTKHFISAFGEHVIAREVEEAMNATSLAHRVAITEYTVAPQVNPVNEHLPYHEWFIEFDQSPADMDSFASQLNAEMVQQNIYYKDLIDGKILDDLKITLIEPHGFRKYMESIGKLGGQNKVPRLMNDRTVAGQLAIWHVERNF